MLRRAIEYGSEHWDFKYPTLFGIKLTELNGALASWPNVCLGEPSRVSHGLVRCVSYTDCMERLHY